MEQFAERVRRIAWEQELPEHIKTLPVPSATFVINTRNEGPDVAETIKSIRGNYSGQMDVIVIADGTVDGSCDNLGADVQVILTEKAIGCGKAKSLGTKHATGDVIFHGDGHHRVIQGSIDDMARLAVAEQAIVCPCLPPLRCWPNEQPKQTVRVFIQEAPKIDIIADGSCSRTGSMRARSALSLPGAT